jgi:hypothetical protein
MSLSGFLVMNINSNKMFQVTKKRCKNCLFSDERIVSPERAEEIVSGCLKDDDFFICHQSSLNEGKVCCRGFYDKYKFDITLARVATIFNQVKFIDIHCKLNFQSFKEQNKNNK